jgi:membrane fusion protein
MRTAAHPASAADPPQLLFRPEVMAARHSQSMGAIRLSQAASGWMIAAVALALSAGLVAFVALGSVSKKARVTGITTPAGGSLTIAANSAGILLRQLVSEGQGVRAGQPLFELSMARQGGDGDVSVLLAQQLSIREQSLDAERRTRARQDRDRRRAIEERLSNLDAEQAQLTSEIGLAQRRQLLARRSLTKFETLEASGFVSTTQTQQKQEDLIDLSSRLETLNRSKVQLQATRIGLLSDRQALAADLAAALAQLDRAQATLKQEMLQNQDRRMTVITAPQSGVLSTVTNQPGQAVAAGQVLATLIPGRAGEDDGLEVHLYAPSRTAGFVAVGQTVLIRYQAYPYQKFGLYEGRVVAVSGTPFAPAELPANLASTILGNAQQAVPGSNSGEALYRIKVRPARQSVLLYGQAHPLKPGMTLEADVLQDRRTIWEWIIAPLLAVARR